MPTEAPLAGTVDRLLALKRHNIFGSLPAADLAIVAEACRERFFRKGRVLFDEEEPIESIFLVIDGQVHMTLDGKLIGHATPGAAVETPMVWVVGSAIQRRSWRRELMER